jgi:hypothetical protein
MKPQTLAFGLAVFAFGVMMGLIIALIIQANILQADMIYPAVKMVWL